MNEKGIVDPVRGRLVPGVDPEDPFELPDDPCTIEVPGVVGVVGVVGVSGSLGSSHSQVIST